MKFVNKNLDVLHTAFIQFENNVIPKAKAKQLVNIASKELEVKFGCAKKEICKVIYDELNEKHSDLSLRLNNLSNYIGSSGIIPNEFPGEVIKVKDSQSETKPKPGMKCSYFCLSSHHLLITSINPSKHAHFRPTKFRHQIFLVLIKN